MWKWTLVYFWPKVSTHTHSSTVVTAYFSDVQYLPLFSFSLKFPGAEEAIVLSTAHSPENTSRDLFLCDIAIAPIISPLSVTELYLSWLADRKKNKKKTVPHDYLLQGITSYCCTSQRGGIKTEGGLRLWVKHQIKYDMNFFPCSFLSSLPPSFSLHISTSRSLIRATIQT